MFRQIIARTDHFRGSSWRLGAEAGHREWLHFVVLGEHVTVLVNFSVADALHAGAEEGEQVGRLTLLVFEEPVDDWEGDVDEFRGEAFRLRAGRIDAAFGESAVRFVDGVFVLTASLRRRPISLELRLRPLVFPSPANNVALDGGEPIHWLVVPRLAATGAVYVGDRVYSLKDASAYHDHNWGRLAGVDYAWEWGVVLAAHVDARHAAVFVRVGNRARTRTYMQALLLWEGARQLRVFRGEELRVTSRGLLRPERVPKLPRVMALLAPALATDVPERLQVKADGGGDWATCEFAPRGVAQIVAPGDGPLSTMIINEVTGHAVVHGDVRGRELKLEGHAVFEFVGG